MDTQLSLDDFLSPEPVKESKPEKKQVLIKPTETAIATPISTSNTSVESEIVDKHEDDVCTDEDVKILSVSELNKSIKEQMESKYTLVWLKGEISNFKPHTSGHFYFSLKDDKSQINAIMFKGFNRLLKFKPRDGMEVIVRGKITVYEPRGSYQIYCEVMEPVGVGALQIAYEQLKSKLQQEGLFDQQKKRQLPTLAQRVAIVTSSTGAAIQDMLNVLNRRMKNLEITIFPCAVQGEKAPNEIVAAIQLANKVGGFDVMIIGRGGGSIEDLWAFNEEVVARAIAASKIPTVSAVGHEVDFTIADFVADLRAPTPSAAAEIISKNTAELEEKIRFYLKSLKHAISKNLDSKRQRLSLSERRLVDPKKKLLDLSIRCDELFERIQNAILQHLNKQKMKLSRPAAVLDSLSPLRVLDRGYSIVKNQEGAVVKKSNALRVGESLQIRLLEGTLVAQVKEIKE